MKHMVHIYTGNGKGKTTAAVGLGIRACGRGAKVLMVQFLKSTETGELKILREIDNFKVYRSTDIKGFFWELSKEQRTRLKKIVQQCFDYAVKTATDDSIDLLILDEIMCTINNRLLSVDKVKNFIINRPEKLEIVLTGRNAPGELIEQAHYVSEIVEIKHPFNQGRTARKGIEF